MSKLSIKQQMRLNVVSENIGVLMPFFTGKLTGDRVISIPLTVYPVGVES